MSKNSRPVKWFAGYLLMGALPVKVVLFAFYFLVIIDNMRRILSFKRKVQVINGGFKHE